MVAGTRKPRKMDAIPGENTRGFTVAELMIVLIVIGLLASVAIPLYQVVPEKSKETEAIAKLVLIRDAMLAYREENATFGHPSFTDGAPVPVEGTPDEEGPTSAGSLGLRREELLGRYYSHECFSFEGTPGQDGFVIVCDGSRSSAPYGSEVARLVYTIDGNGSIDGGVRAGLGRR
jgi:prepilin-type N-terminal cleavage/methylation domain-containing protein